MTADPILTRGCWDSSQATAATRDGVRVDDGVGGRRTINLIRDVEEKYHVLYMYNIHYYISSCTS